TVASGTRDFFVTLDKGGGSIDVQTAADPNVAGATIYVDGDAKGVAPNVADVPEGRHLVELKKPRYGDFAQWVTLKAGERVSIAPVLKGSSKGALLVDADLPAASVTVDGRHIDDTTPAL